MIFLDLYATAGWVDDLLDLFIIFPKGALLNSLSITDNLTKTVRWIFKKMIKTTLFNIIDNMSTYNREEALSNF